MPACSGSDQDGALGGLLNKVRADAHVVSQAHDPGSGHPEAWAGWNACTPAHASSQQLHCPLTELHRQLSSVPAGQTGMQVIPTNEPGNVSSWSYATVGGSLPFGPAMLPVDASSWPVLRDIQLCWSLNFLMATHICRQEGKGVGWEAKKRSHQAVLWSWSEQAALGTRELGAHST